MVSSPIFSSTGAQSFLKNRQASVLELFTFRPDAFIHFIAISRALSTSLTKNSIEAPLLGIKLSSAKANYSAFLKRGKINIAYGAGSTIIPCTVPNSKSKQIELGSKCLHTNVSS